MHTAAKDGNEFTMQGLFRLGAYINIKDNDGVRGYTTDGGLVSVSVAISQERGMYTLFVHK